MERKPIIFTPDQHKILVQAAQLYNGMNGLKKTYGEAAAIFAGNYIDHVKSKQSTGTGTDDDK